MKDKGDRLFLFLKESVLSHVQIVRPTFLDLFTKIGDRQRTISLQKVGDE